MQMYYFYGVKTLVITARAVVTVKAATAVVGVVFEVLVWTTRTGTKVAVAATDQSNVVSAASDGMVAEP